MMTVTICGSMRFAEEMKTIAMKLETVIGWNVIQCIYDVPSIITREQHEQLVMAHYCKIDLSDAIYVVDIDGYIGESTQAEILYAQKQGKNVLYHSKLYPHYCKRCPEFAFGKDGKYESTNQEED